MKLDKVRELFDKAESALALEPFVIVATFATDGRRRTLHVALTDRLRKQSKRGHAWKSKEMLSAFKNAAYGYNAEKTYSPGGSDGIFALSRDYRPKNAMMKKIFERFLDKKESGAEALAETMGANLDDLLPVRLVSHHLRLLGVLKRGSVNSPGDNQDLLVLVDYDDTKP